MENFTINREKKTFVFDDGEEIPIPKDKVREVLRSPYARQIKDKQKEMYQKLHEGSFLPSVSAFKQSAEESFLGAPGETAANYLISAFKGISPGEGQEQFGYVDRVLDNFYAMQDAKKEYMQDLSQKHPTATKIGTGAGMLGELVALRKVPASVALPIMGAAHSETSFLEPGKKAKEATKDAIIGYTLDKFFGATSKIAGHRQTRRTLQDAIKSTEEANLAEMQRAATATEADAARFAQEQAAREAELARIPGLQQAENQAFAQSSAQRVDRIAKTMGKTPIESAALGVEEFIENNIGRSANAASSEANQASRFLRSVFKPNAEGKITGDMLKKGMNALDEAILKSEGTTRDILMSYRDEVLQAFPYRMANSYVAEKWTPRIIQRIGNVDYDITHAFRDFPEVSNYVFERVGTKFPSQVAKETKSAVNGVLDSIKGNFVEGIQDASIQQKIEEAIRNSPSYQKMVKEMDSFFAKNFLGLPKETIFRSVPNYKALEEFVLQYPQKVADRVTKAAQKYFPDISLDATTKSGIAERSISAMPRMPNIVVEPPPVAPAQTVNPNLQPVPQLPQPQGMYEKLAVGLENLTGKSVKDAVGTVKDNAGVGILAKLMGIPLGKLTLGAGAAATGLKAITSPSVGGQVLREGLSQAARATYSAEERAKKYKSYHDGILDDPQERRSLTKEIEEDPNIPLSQKAILQSKINRGKPLFDRLQ